MHELRRKLIFNDGLAILFAALVVVYVAALACITQVGAQEQPQELTPEIALQNLDAVCSKVELNRNDTLITIRSVQVLREALTELDRLRLIASIYEDTNAKTAEDPATPPAEIK